MPVSPLTSKKQTYPQFYIGARGSSKTCVLRRNTASLIVGTPREPTGTRNVAGQRDSQVSHEKPSVPSPRAASDGDAGTYRPTLRHKLSFYREASSSSTGTVFSPSCNAQTASRRIEEQFTPLSPSFQRASSTYTPIDLAPRAPSYTETSTHDQQKFSDFLADFDHDERIIATRIACLHLHISIDRGVMRGVIDSAAHRLMKSRDSCDCEPCVQAVVQRETERQKEETELIKMLRDVNINVPDMEETGRGGTATETGTVRRRRGRAMSTLKEIAEDEQDEDKTPPPQKVGDTKGGHGDAKGNGDVNDEVTAGENAKHQRDVALETSGRAAEGGSQHHHEHSVVKNSEGHNRLYEEGKAFPVEKWRQEIAADDEIF